MRRVIFGRNLKVTLLRAAVWVVVCVVVFKLLLVHIRVDGISMLPTCPDQSVYWVNRLAYVRHPPQRGDVVAIRFIQTDKAISHLEPPHIMLLKRIIGLPGETVAFVNGRVLINGEILDEPTKITKNSAVTGTPRRSHSVPINTTSSATTVPCRRKTMCMANANGTKSWERRGYENGVAARPAGRAHRGGRLALDDSLSQPGKNRPQTAGAGRQ